MGVGAINAAVTALASGQTVVMLPEGWAHLDGRTRPFKAGVAYIAQEAARRLGRPLPLVPVAIRYGRNPGPWIRRLPPPLQYLLVLALFARYRRGVTVVVGEPISSASLPVDYRAATDTLREIIAGLDPATETPIPTAARPRGAAARP